MHDVVCPRHARGEREEYAVGAHIAAGGVEAQNAGKAQRAADELAAVRPFVAEGDAGDDHQHGIDEVQRGGKARGEVVIGRKEQRTDEPVADAADRMSLSSCRLRRSFSRTLPLPLHTRRMKKITMPAARRAKDCVSELQPPSLTVLEKSGFRP